MSMGFSASIERASCSGGRPALRLPPMSGALPPACEVEKNTGSNSSKSCSSRMRAISTEPTMPRQPTIPTFCIFLSLVLLERRDHRVAHFARADLLRRVGVDVRRPQARGEHLAHRALDALGRLGLIETVA